MFFYVDTMSRNNVFQRGIKNRWKKSKDVKWWKLSAAAVVEI
ncbi:hypothetical protein PUN28_008508 [Cardiocondyla obscurior]|uniref:Ribosomal protein L32 n=1 Tax=Cardiocondyla obscurior TaxID=286306 RepID=A0AAW2G1E5_9HYME